MVQKTLDRKGIVEAALAFGILATRFLFIGPSAAWRDTVVILSAYWIFSVLCPLTRARTIGTVATIAFLFVIYVWGASPHILNTFGIES